MKGSEFLRKLRKLAAQKGTTVHLSVHGKGSHSRIYFGGRFTTLKDPMGTGLLHAMCKDLGVDPKEL